MRYFRSLLGLSKSLMLNAIIAGATVALVAMPLSGMLGDRIGNRRVFAIGSVAICIFSFPFFQLLADARPAAVYIAMMVAIGGIYSLLYASEGNLFSSQFPAEVRYSGISLAVQVSGALGGGLAPMLATWLLMKGNGHPGLLAGYLSVLGVIGIYSVSRMRPESV